MYINGVFLKKARFFNRGRHFEDDSLPTSADALRNLELEDSKKIEVKAIKGLPFLQPIGS